MIQRPIHFKDYADLIGTNMAKESILTYRANQKSTNNEVDKDG